MLASVLDDLRCGVRMLGARTGLSLAVVLILALGIGANTAVFSAIEAQLLRPLPYPDDERLVAIDNSYPLRGDFAVGNTVPDYLDRRAAAPALAESALYYDYSFDLTDTIPPQRVSGAVATPSLFSVLGISPQVGRTFTPAEAEPLHDVDAVWAGAARIVLLGDALWRSRYGADPGIVGRDIRVSGNAYRVIGVMPATFAFPRPEVQMWLPFAFSERQRADRMRGFEFAGSIGRLAPGATIEQLHAQFDAIVARNRERLSGPDSSTPEFTTRIDGTGFRGRARSLRATLAGDTGPTLWLLQAAALLVLLIACANAATLMLIRWQARQRELGLRVALGAGRSRIARQLLLENSLLATAGGVAGVAIAHTGVALLDVLGLDTGAINLLRPSVMAMAVLSTGISLLLASIAPLLALRHSQPAIALAIGGRGDNLGSRHGGRQRDLLIVAQLALATVLLVGGGLLAHSYWRLQQVSPGFVTNNVITANLNLSRDRYRDVAATARFHRELGDAVSALPGMLSAGIVSGLPFSADYGFGPYRIEGDDAALEAAVANQRIADAGYFRTLQIPLLRGRGFTVADDADNVPVTIIDDRLAAHAFGDRDPLGARLGTPGIDGAQHWHTIVGVVASVRQESLSAPDQRPTAYMPVLQQPPRIARLVVRSQRPVDEVALQLRDVLARVDPEQPLWQITTMDQRVSDSLTGRRTPMLLLILFASIALTLAAVGVFAALAWSVAQRRGEIGVRMALGATRDTILRSVLREGGRVVVTGMLLGGGLSALLATQLRAHLFGVDPLDPLTLAVALGLVGMTAALACWIPARRAAAVSPMEALRGE